MFFSKYHFVLAVLPSILSARSDKSCRVSRSPETIEQSYRPWDNGTNAVNNSLATDGTAFLGNGTLEGQQDKYLISNETILQNGTFVARNDTRMTDITDVNNGTFVFNNGTVVYNNGTIVAINGTGLYPSNGTMWNPNATVPSNSTVSPNTTLPINSTVPERRNNTPWIVQADYSGTTFFDGFDFADIDDPNHGLVNYVNREKAFADGLAFWTSDGVPGIQAEHWRETQVGEARDSVRLHSKAVYNGGLFVIDLKEMPWGCGVWPAFWTLGYGAEWPQLEGIHERTENQYTIHTTDGCTLDASPGLFTGKVRGTECAVSKGAAGCAVIPQWKQSYGKPFNAAGGGVFAMLWDSNGLHFWEWTREQIPADVQAGAPDLPTWGKPSAFLSASQCDPWKYFVNHQLIFTINLCGDWARNSWPSYCPGTCAERIANPANLNNTMFLINYIKVYQALPTDAAVPSPELVHHTSGHGTDKNGSQSTSGALKLAEDNAAMWAVALFCCLLVNVVG